MLPVKASRESECHPRGLWYFQDLILLGQRSPAGSTVATPPLSSLGSGHIIHRPPAVGNISPEGNIFRNASWDVYHCHKTISWFPHVWTRQVCCCESLQ